MDHEGAGRTSPAAMHFPDGHRPGADRDSAGPPTEIAGVSTPPRGRRENWQRHAPAAAARGAFVVHRHCCREVPDYPPLVRQLQVAAQLLVARSSPVEIIDAMNILLLIALALWWFACAVTAGIIATDRYLNGVAYFCIGLFMLGPLAVGVALLATPGQPELRN